MARVYKQPSIVSGKSVKDIINMDIDTFNKLNERELRKVVGRLVSAGNKRIRAFHRVGETSPALRAVYDSGGTFSTINKYTNEKMSLNELRAEFARARNFFNQVTSSVTTWRKVKRKTIKALALKGVEITDEQFSEFWQAYERLKEDDPSISIKGLKYSVLENLADMFTDKNINIDAVIDDMRKKLVSIYEEQARANDGFSGVSGFFK